MLHAHSLVRVPHRLLARPAALLMLLAALGAPGLAAGAGSDPTANPTLAKRGVRYQLHPSDLLEVNFRLSPEFNATVPVQPDGYVTLPNLGSVLVAGLTLDEATANIRTKAAERLNEPEVTVALKQFETPYFIVGGQVANPGKVEKHGTVTVLAAVQLAGGFKEGAQTKQVVLIRQVDSERAETRLINYKYLLQHPQANEDIELQAGDMIYVPQNTLSKITPYVKLISPGVYLNPFNF